MPTWSIDQSRLSLASAEIDFANSSGGGVTCRGIQEFTLTDEVEKDPVYGNDSFPIGLPRGTWKGSGSFSTIPEEADLLCQSLGNGWSTKPLSCGLSLSEPDGAPCITWNVYGMYLKKREAKLGKAGGSDPSFESFDFIVIQPIDWNGIQSVESTAPDTLSGIVGDLLSSI